MLLQHSTEQTPPTIPPPSPPVTPPLSDMQPVAPMIEWRRAGEEEEELEDEGEEQGLSEVLHQLRDVVGSDASDEVLKNLLLAADMDVNRAVNFYFSSLS